MIIKNGGDDMHYKMCKKIAQLTKVIYKLNTQNEDNDTWVLQLRNKHEEELRTVYSDAQCKIEEFQTAFSESDKRSKAAVETVEQRYKAELNEAKEAYARKLELMTDELLASKKMFEKTVAEIKEKSKKKVEEDVAKLLTAKDADVAKLVAAKEEEMASLRLAKETEVAELVREYNDRYKSMLAEQLDARDKLKESADLLQSRLDDAATAHAAEVQQWAKKLEAAEAAIASATAELAQLRESNALFEADKTRLQQECEALRDLLSAEINSHGTSRDAETLVRQEAELLRRQLSEAQAARDNFQRISDEQKAALAKAFSNLTDMENKKCLLETQLSRYESSAAAAEQNNLQLKDQIATLERRVTELQELIALADEKMESHRQTEQSFEERCNGLQRKIDLLVEEHRKELAELRASHESALLVMNSALQKSNNTLMEKLSWENEQLEKKHLEELRDLRERHAQQLSQLTKEYEDIVGDLRNKLEDACGIEKTLRETIADLQRHVAEVETRLTDACNAVQAANAHEKDLIAKHKAVIEDFKEQLANVETCTNAKFCAQQEINEKKIRELEAELVRLRTHYTEELRMSKINWENNCRYQAEEHEQLMHKLRLEHSERLQGMNSAQQAKIAELQAMHMKEMQRCGETAKHELERERQKHFQAQAELTNELRRCEEALRHSKDQLDAVRQSGKEQLTRMSEEVRALKEHVANLTGDVESLQKELKAMTAALQHSSNECADLKKALCAAEERKRDLMSAYDELEKSKNKSLLEIDALHKNYVASIEIRHAQKLQSALDELRAALTAEHNAAQRCADEMFAAMRQKYTESQEEVRRLKLDVDKLTSDLKKSLEEVQREQLNVEAAKKTLAETVEAMRRDFAAERDQQQRLTERHMNEVATNHRVIVTDLMQQHRESEIAQNARLKELQAAFDDLRHRYEYRESRAEDVTMINNLIKEGRQKDQALKKAMSDLEMYKLELINREENYNKVFGRQPRVSSVMSADKKQLKKY